MSGDLLRRSALSAMSGELWATAICSLCDERRATGYGESATMTGELSYSDDDDWVFYFFRFGTESVLGFFFVFFGTESVLSLVYCFCFFLVCFDFALIVIFRLSQYLKIDFLCDLCSDVTVVQWVSFISDFLLVFFFFLESVGGWVCSAGLAFTNFFFFSRF